MTYQRKNQNGKVLMMKVHRKISEFQKRIKEIKIKNEGIASSIIIHQILKRKKFKQK